eukprot:scaffold74463_cov25-Tisochrysis_lutea.AAC.2
MLWVAWWGHRGWCYSLHLRVLLPASSTQYHSHDLSLPHMHTAQSLPSQSAELGCVDGIFCAMSCACIHQHVGVCLSAHAVRAREARVLYAHLTGHMAPRLLQVVVAAANFERRQLCHQMMNHPQCSSSSAVPPKRLILNAHLSQLCHQSASFLTLILFSCAIKPPQ